VLRFVKVSLGSGHPPRCSRCGGPVGHVSHRPVPEVADEMDAIVRAWDEGPGPNVELTGPEPFAHPDLPALVSAAGRAGVRRLRLATDAVALVSPGNASGCVAAGVRHLAVTLLGGSAGVHDALTGGPGALEATLAGVNSYVAAADAQEAAVCVTARVPVCRHNVRDLVATVGAAVQAGADGVEISIADGGLDLASALPWITAACDTGIVNAVWVEVDGVPFCLLPGYDLHLADTVRARPGLKAAACAACQLDRFCGSGPVGAAAETLAMLVPPDGAGELAARVAVSRGVVS